jgi:hypothetical protein
MRPLLGLLVLLGCRSNSAFDARVCAAATGAEVARARQALASMGVGEHEVSLGDGHCWRLHERRSENGPRVWELFAVTPRGPRLRLHIELGFGATDADRGARHLEHPSEWVVGSEWTEYADTIRTCRDEPDGGLRCAGSAVP